MGGWNPPIPEFHHALFEFCRVQLIFLPFLGIRADVIPYFPEFVFIADDMVIIVALPDMETRSESEAVDMLCRNCFKCAY
jgi:hypothetical protein